MPSLPFCPSLLSAYLPTVPRCLYLSTALIHSDRFCHAGLELGLTAVESASGVRRLLIKGDSQLVIMQMRGEWHVSEPRLQQRHALCKARLRALGVLPVWEHVEAAFNWMADELAHKAITAGPGGGRV